MGVTPVAEVGVAVAGVVGFGVGFGVGVAVGVLVGLGVGRRSAGRGHAGVFCNLARIGGEGVDIYQGQRNEQEGEAERGHHELRKRTSFVVAFFFRVTIHALQTSPTRVRV